MLTGLHSFPPCSLNAPEWPLRGAFFGAVASIGAYTGRESLDVFLLPCLEQVSRQCVA